MGTWFVSAQPRQAPGVVLQTRCDWNVFSLHLQRTNTRFLELDRDTSTWQRPPNVAGLEKPAKEPPSRSEPHWQNRPQAKSPNRHTYPSIYAEKARTSSQTTYIMSDSNGLHQRPLSYQSPSIGQVEQALEVAHSCGDTLDSMRYTYGFQSIILAAKCNSSCA